jgi:hypothetical protein
LNPQKVSISAKTRKINKENTEVRKRKAEANQRKHKLTTRKPANNINSRAKRGNRANTGTAKKKP